MGQSSRTEDENVPLSATDVPYVGMVFGCLSSSVRAKLVAAASSQGIIVFSVGVLRF